MHEYKLKLTQEVGLFDTLASTPAPLVLSALLQVLCSRPVCSVSRSGRWSIQGAVMIPHIQERLTLNLPATVGMRVAIGGKKKP